eukprot:scaffold52_cov109-Isochrysis_galbana.AAC.8
MLGWLSELIGSVEARLFLDRLRARQRRSSGSAGSVRRSRRGRGGASSVGSLPSAGSPLPSISENELLSQDDASLTSRSPPVSHHAGRGSKRGMAVVGAGGASADDDHYIVAADEFAMDADGFLVPREP